MTTYNIAGVTYNQDMVPIGFDESYTGPKNAQVGAIKADNGETYGVYANYNQTNNQVQDSSGNVVYKGFTNVKKGNIADGYDSSLFSDQDKQSIELSLGQAVASGNIKSDTTGLSNIPPAEGPINNPDYGQPADPKTWPSGNTSTQGDMQLDVKFGKVDSIIKKLHLRNLIYPIDADFGNTQDYMQISQFKYRPPNQNLFFGEDKEKTASGNDPGQIGTQGVPMGTPREEFLGLVKLPMPNSLADSNNVSWGTDQLNALTAAVSSGVFGQVPEIKDLVKGAIDRGLNFKNIGTTFSEGGRLIKKAFNDAREGGASILDELGDSNSNLSVLGSSVVGSALLNVLQFGISPETVLARGQGVVPNNNLALLFNSPTLREFQFTWKMTPRSREEAQRVNNIIRFFKQGMAPKKGIDTSTGGGSFFLGTPNVFDIAFKTTTDGGNFFFDGDDRNNSVVRIKTCACTGAAVNYTPDGMWNAYDRGQPVSVTMSLRFSELEPIFDTDYDENVFNYDPNRKDLDTVPIDAVGY